MPRLIFMNGVKTKVLRNIANVDEQQKFTFRESKTFNRIGLLSVSTIPHSYFYVGVRCGCGRGDSCRQGLI